MLLLGGSINWNLPQGYALSFFLAGIALVSVFHTYRNLNGLEITVAAPDVHELVFAGGTANFTVKVLNLTGRQRFGLQAEHNSVHRKITNLPANGIKEVFIPVEAKERGYLRPSSFTVSTRFPLSLFYASHSVCGKSQCLVYPKPDNYGLSSPLVNDNHKKTEADDSGDYCGLRSYQQGDPLGHVAWKVVARSRGMHTKQYAEPRAPDGWLDWGTFTQIDSEARLSCLTRWAVDAHASGFVFGLRLPTIEVSPGSGIAHLKVCLRELALFNPIACQPL
jgi:uncharacterized protein (DUF58 family)